MRISKLLPVLCTLAIGANCLTARAEDNAAQAAARAALASRAFDLSGPAATNTASANVAMTPASTKESREEAKAKAKADKAAAEAKAQQDAAALKAKNEADKKLAEQQAAQAKAKGDKAMAKATKPATDNQTQAQKAAMAQTSSTKTMTNNMASAKTQPVAKAKKEKKKKAVETANAAGSQTNSVPVENYAGKELGMQPVAAPPPPVPAGKVEKLQALLAKYRADQISPEEYQKQRAAILSGQ